MFILYMLRTETFILSYQQENYILVNMHTLGLKTKIGCILNSSNVFIVYSFLFYAILYETC